MTIRSDSYSSTSEVKAFTRHLLDGQSAFNSTTRPTGTELEKFIDRASAALNIALRGRGLAIPVTNSTAKLVCDDWVTARATQYVELTQRGVGYAEGEGSRTMSFERLSKEANEFAKFNALGFIYLGVTQSNKLSDGLDFTGLDSVADRADPDDGSLAQPLFTRGLFDDPEGTGRSFTEDEEYE